jgi:hypothetical protein
MDPVAYHMQVVQQKRNTLAVTIVLKTLRGTNPVPAESKHCLHDIVVCADSRRNYVSLPCSYKTT